MNRTDKKWTAALAAVLAITGFGVWALGPSASLDVTTGVVTEGAITRTIVATGTLQAVTTVEVGTQVSGAVQALGADFNSIVHKGQVIARLDPSLYAAQARQARAAAAQAGADLAAARADLDGLRTAQVDAQTKLKRAEALSEDDLIPTADFDAATIAAREAEAAVSSGVSRVAQAEAGVAQARAAVKQAEQNLDYTIIRSPIDGIVIDRAVDIGQTLAASIAAPELFRIASDFRHLQMQVEVDESDVAGPRTGEPVVFEVEAYPNQVFSGRVMQVRLQPVAEQTITATTVNQTGTTTPGAATSVPSVVGYTTIVDVANPDERLRPGMTATVTFGGVSHERAIRLPNAALTFRPPANLDALAGIAAPATAAVSAITSAESRTRLVWQFDGRRFTPIQVQTGLTDREWTEALAGSVHPGDHLVTEAAVKRVSRISAHIHGD